MFTKTIFTHTTLLIFIILIGALNAVSQDYLHVFNKVYGYQQVILSSDTTADERVITTRGILDDTGSLLFSMEADHIGTVEESGFRVIVNGRTGLVDKKGEWVIKPTYEILGELSEGYVLAGNDTTLQFVLDATGQMVATLPIPVTVAPTTPKKEIIKQPGADASFRATMRPGHNFKYSSGLALVNGKYLNLKGECVLVIPRMFNDQYHCVNGMILYRKGKKYGFYNKRGSLVIPPKYDFAKEFTEDGTALVAYDAAHNRKRYLLINKAGQVVKKYDLGYDPRRGF